VDAAAEAVTRETGYRYEAARDAESDRSVFNHWRRYTTRIYNNTVQQEL